MWKTQGLLDSRKWKFLLLTRGTRHSQDPSRTLKSMWKVIWILYGTKNNLFGIAQITFPSFSPIWASWSFVNRRQKQINGLEAAGIIRDLSCFSSIPRPPLPLSIHLRTLGLVGHLDHCSQSSAKNSTKCSRRSPFFATLVGNYVGYLGSKEWRGSPQNQTISLWFNYNLMLLDHYDKTNYSNTEKCGPAGTVAFAVDTTQ